MLLKVIWVHGCTHLHAFQARHSGPTGTQLPPFGKAISREQVFHRPLSRLSEALALGDKRCICLLMSIQLGGKDMVGGSPCVPVNHMPPLQEGFLDSSSQRHSGDPAWQEEKEPAFLCLPAVSVICPSQGLPRAWVPLSRLLMYSQEQPPHSPQGCPRQLASAFPQGRTSASHLHGGLWPCEPPPSTGSALP